MVGLPAHVLEDAKRIKIRDGDPSVVATMTRLIAQAIKGSGTAQ